MEGYKKPFLVGNLTLSRLVVFTSAHRRKLQAKMSVGVVSSVPLPPASVPPSLHSTGASSGDLLGVGGEGPEESSEGEEGDTEPPRWNWRDDERQVPLSIQHCRFSHTLSLKTLPSHSYIPMEGYYKSHI